ncbi:MAG: hypothetical protein E6K68_07800, partial [Nitrospirae bacterium]
MKKPIINVVLLLLVGPFSEAGVQASETRMQEKYGTLPLSFEANRGQTDPRVKFLSRGPHHMLFLTSDEAVMVFMTQEPSAQGEPGMVKPEKRERATQTALRMQFAGANLQARVQGQEELPGKANYFTGNDPTKWRTNVPTYAKVRYDNLYPGIDLIYYGNQRQLEHDFVVRPDADPSSIALSIQGADTVEVDAQGDLVLHTAAGPIRLRKPVFYQEVNGIRKEIPGGYVIKDSHQVGFQVAAYDASRPLIIDPVLSYSTYLGGIGRDSGFGIAVDALGNAYVSGVTASTNFPTTPGAFQTTFGSFFVTKLDPTGSAFVYSTYLGGMSLDEFSGLAVDAAGNAYVTGNTDSSNFPTTLGAFQTAIGGFVDAFVTKLNPSGSALVYSTFLGGSGFDEGLGIAVDAAGNAYVTGLTLSTDFPTTAEAFQPASVGSDDVFVTKLNPTGSALVYSTYLGGGGTDDVSGIAVDASGNAYLTGVTDSADFPTTLGALQTLFGGDADAFVTKLDPTGATLVYSTFLGGSGFDDGLGIAVDASGNAYLTGVSDSTDFPTTLGAFQTASGGGGGDTFVTKLNPAGTALVYSTYLGGSSNLDEGFGIAVDAAGNAHVMGLTFSTDFPTTAEAFQSNSGGFIDAFVTKLDPTGSALLYSTYLGGSGSDQGRGIALDAAGNVYVTGFTDSTDFPISAGALQTFFGGGADAFVVKFATSVTRATTTDLASSATPSVFGQPVILTATVSPVASAGTRPTGTVNFLDGATLLGTGTLNEGSPDTASFETSVLTAGSHSLSAVYQGDANF